jgi:hypothetical protein
METPFLERLLEAVDASVLTTDRKELEAAEDETETTGPCVFAKATQELLAFLVVIVVSTPFSDD